MGVTQQVQINKDWLHNFFLSSTWWHFTPYPTQALLAKPFHKLFRLYTTISILQYKLTVHSMLVNTMQYKIPITNGEGNKNELNINLKKKMITMGTFFIYCHTGMM